MNNKVGRTVNGYKKFYYYYYCSNLALLLAASNGASWGGCFGAASSGSNRDAGGATPGFRPRQQLQQQQQQHTGEAESAEVVRNERDGREEMTSRAMMMTNFTDAANNKCDEAWESWPLTQGDALRDGTLIVFKVFASVGNLFIALNDLITIARLLDLGLVLDWKDSFPGFGEAFEAAEITWDVDPDPWWHRASELEKGGTASSRFQAMTFNDGAMILSENQLARLFSILHVHGNKSLPDLAAARSFPASGRGLREFAAGIHNRLIHERHGAVWVDPCAWNLFLHASPALIKASEEHIPWEALEPNDGMVHTTSQRRLKFVAWHIRTADAETMRSFDPTVHKYILQETPEVVCKSFLDATEAARQACPMLFPDEELYVFISSTSKIMARSCIADLAAHGIIGGQVDMGLAKDDVHTESSRHRLQAAMNAFLDFVFLVHATVMIRTASTFSGSASKIGGLGCTHLAGNQLSLSGMSVCVPQGVLC